MASAYRCATVVLRAPKQAAKPGKTQRKRQKATQCAHFSNFYRVASHLRENPSFADFPSRRKPVAAAQLRPIAPKPAAKIGLIAMRTQNMGVFGPPKQGYRSRRAHLRRALAEQVPLRSSLSKSHSKPAAGAQLSIIAYNPPVLKTGLDPPLLPPNP